MSCFSSGAFFCTSWFMLGVAGAYPDLRVLSAVREGNAKQGGQKTDGKNKTLPDANHQKLSLSLFVCVLFHLGKQFSSGQCLIKGNSSLGVLDGRLN